MHRAYRVVAGAGRSDRARLVSASSLDFHAVHLLEPVALHGAKFRIADDVRAPLGAGAEFRGKKCNSSLVHCVVSPTDAELSYGILGRRADSLPRVTG